MASDRAAARRLILDLVEAYNAKDLDGVLRHYAPEARYWSPLDDWHSGQEELARHVRTLFQTLPDERMDVQTLVTDGETAVAEFRSTGAAPSGDRYAIDFTEVFEIRYGRIVEARAYLDPEDVTAISG